MPQWYALPVDGSKDLYIITPAPADLNPPGLARRGNSVILAAEPDEWRLQYIPIKLAGGEVYELAFLLDFTFHRTDLFRKDSCQGVNWSCAPSWEGKTQERGRTPVMAILMTMCLSVFCVGRDSVLRCWLCWAKASLAIPDIQ